MKTTNDNVGTSWWPSGLRCLRSGVIQSQDMFCACGFEPTGLHTLVKPLINCTNNQLYSCHNYKKKNENVNMCRIMFVL